MPTYPARSRSKKHLPSQTRRVDGHMRLYHREYHDRRRHIVGVGRREGEAEASQGARGGRAPPTKDCVVISGRRRGRSHPFTVPRTEDQATEARGGRGWKKSREHREGVQPHAYAATERTGSRSGGRGSSRDSPDWRRDPTWRLATSHKYMAKLDGLNAYVTTLTRA